MKATRLSQLGNVGMLDLYRKRQTALHLLALDGSDSRHFVQFLGLNGGVVLLVLLAVVLVMSSLNL